MGRSPLRDLRLGEKELKAREERNGMVRCIESLKRNMTRIFFRLVVLAAL